MEVLEIEDVRLPIVLERSNRKTLTIQITKDMQLQIKAPLYISEREIYRFVQQKRFWIYKRAKSEMETAANRVERSEEEIKRLRQQARVTLTQRSILYAKRLGVSFNKIRIGNQRTRWGEL